jgi:hypothetical protein
MSFCLHEMGHNETAAICFYVRKQSPVHMMSLASVNVLFKELTESLGEGEMARLEDVARGLDFAATLNLAESRL